MGGGLVRGSSTMVEQGRWEVGLHQILGNERGYKALWRCAAVVRLKAYVVVPPAPENTPAVTNV